MIATPSAAMSPGRSRGSPALEPTSTPTVGLLSTSTRGSRAIHFASTTRCWLPPESVRTGSAGIGVLIAGRRTHSSDGLGRPARRRAARARPASAVDVAGRRCCARSTGRGTGPASAGPPARRRCRPRPHPRSSERTSRPSTLTVPASAGPGRTATSAISVRPEPSRPVDADDLAGSQRRGSTSANRPGRPRPLTSSTGRRPRPRVGRLASLQRRDPSLPRSASASNSDRRR